MGIYVGLREAGRPLSGCETGNKVDKCVRNPGKSPMKEGITDINPHSRLP